MPTLGQQNPSTTFLSMAVWMSVGGIKIGEAPKAFIKGTYKGMTLIFIPLKSSSFVIFLFV